MKEQFIEVSQTSETMFIVASTKKDALNQCNDLVTLGYPSIKSAQNAARRISKFRSISLENFRIYRVIQHQKIEVDRSKILPGKIAKSEKLIIKSNQTIERKL